MTSRGVGCGSGDVVAGDRSRIGTDGVDGDVVGGAVGVRSTGGGSGSSSGARTGASAAWNRLSGNRSLTSASCGSVAGWLWQGVVIADL